MLEHFIEILGKLPKILFCQNMNLLATCDKALEKITYFLDLILHKTLVLEAK